MIESLRKALRRKTALPPERLRDPKVAYRLLGFWSDAIDRISAPLRLANTDGDPLLLTSDRWTFDPAERPAVVHRIAAIEDAEPGAEPEEDDVDVFVILRADGTVLGRIVIGEAMVTAETNSIARADALKKRIESACSGLLSLQLRSHEEVKLPSRQQQVPPPEEVTEERAAIIRRYKEQHYAAWPDTPLPAFGGLTPREAVRTRQWRARAAALLDQIAFNEALLDEALRFDVASLRRALGLKS